MRRSPPPKRKTPLKRSRKPIPKRSKRTAWVRKKDAEWQAGVPKEGECRNCKKWRPLCGDHRIKRRFREHRWDPANRFPACKECNGDFESLSCQQLLDKYPRSPLRQEWIDRHVKTYGTLPHLR